MVSTNININHPREGARWLAIKRQVANSRRNSFILKLVRSLEKSGRDILVLSDRKEHLSNLNEQYTGSSGLFMGNAKKEEIPTEKVIFATWQKLGRALSVNRLNTLVLASVRTGVIQAAGRITRVKHALKPFVVDLVDEGPYYRDAWEKRFKSYRKAGWKVVKYNPNTKMQTVLYNGE